MVLTHLLANDFMSVGRLVITADHEGRSPD